MVAIKLFLGAAYLCCLLDPFFAVPGGKSNAKTDIK